LHSLAFFLQLKRTNRRFGIGSIQQIENVIRYYEHYSILKRKIIMHVSFNTSYVDVSYITTGNITFTCVTYTIMLIIHYRYR